MKRAIGAILFVVYSIIAIAVTVLLLSYNDYNISEIGGYTVYIVRDDSLEPQYEKGSILLIEKSSDKNIQAGEEILLYKVVDSEQFEIVIRTLEEKAQQGRHITYKVEDQETYDSQYCIGKTENVTVISGPWGTILSILESKWGYLFCIVVVSLLLFLQEVFDLIIELKYGGTKGTKAANAASARKAATKKKTTNTTSTKTVAAKSNDEKVATTAKATTSKATTTKKTTNTTTKKAATVAKTVATAAKVNSAETEEKEG